MPFSGNTFTNVSGATTAVAGDIVQSAVWDNIHTDYATAFTMLMSQLTSGISYRNGLYMNGGFEVWQRGAGSSASIAVAASTLAYTADRWYIHTQPNQAMTISAQAGLTNSSNLCGRILRNAAQTGTGTIIFAYPFDTDEIARLRGSKVSLTMSVKAGANWSPTSGTLTVVLYAGTGAVAKRDSTPYTNETSVFSISTNLTAGGAVTTITGNSSAILPVATTQLELSLQWAPIGTAGAADSFDIDDVQLEAQLSSSTWTPTSYDKLPFFAMFDACQRHYAKSFVYNTAPVQNGGTVGSIQLYAMASNVSVGAYVQFPTKLRATAGTTTYNPSGANSSWRNYNSSADITSAVNPSTGDNDTSIFITGVSVSALGQLIGIHYTASAGI